MWDGWRKLGILEDRKKKKTTRPTRKEQYTGFVFTERPRWFQPRAPRYQPHPVVPPQQLKSYEAIHSTKAPPHLLPPTTPRPESTTQWWPLGVSHGPRPVSRIPIQIVYPEIGRWEMDWSKVKVRTSGTRWTYAPEVVNYPVTFNWNMPRHLRKDKWTQRPDWPLESPLWSSEAYDYLEERTLPRILESGETEYPPTSPLPWWTYPPWWLEKKGLESINGTTPRPHTRKTTVKTRSKPKEEVKKDLEIVETSTLFSLKEKTAYEEKLKKDYELKRTSQIDLSAINNKYSETASTYLSKKTQEVKSSSENHEITQASSGTSEKTQLHKKTHHKGPWWHLTVVEHFTTKAPEDRGKKRVKRSPKLVRQNAFRRKWRDLRQRKNLSYTLDLRKTKSSIVSKINSSPSIQRVLSNYTFTWPKVSLIRTQSKVYIEDVLTKAIDELGKLLTAENSLGSQPHNVPKSQTNFEIENHLADLRRLFLIALNNYFYKEDRSLIFYIVTHEIGKEMVKHLLNRTNIVRLQLDRLLERIGILRYRNPVRRSYLGKCRLISLYELLCIHNLIDLEISDKINNAFNKLFVENIDFLNQNSTNKHSSNLKTIQGHNNLNKKYNVEKKLFRSKREDIIDITECPFNFSAQSVENVVDQIVDEIIDEMPVDEINEEVKTDVLTTVHENQLKRLGKTNINRDVLREMMKIESVDEAKFKNATKDSVRKVIMMMANEVLNTLKQHAWMKDLIIKLFEEGYSVESVLETISNQISIEEILKSMEKDGISITHYQKIKVLDEFKGFKSLLKKMLTQEVQLWEYELAKNHSLIRHKRDVLSTHEKNEKVELERNDYKIFIGKIPFFFCKPPNSIDKRDTINKKMKKFSSRIHRMKRDISDNEILSSSGINTNSDDYNIVDEDLDKELAELKKSSMPKREKIKVLKKRLKGLLDQTENPNDIVFPDNFEEELMRTENFYDDEVTPSPQRFKQRIRWNVRTKKPTTKVITYPMKIQLNRGRPFVPLTTTEEQTLIMVVTKTPSRKSRTKKPAAKTKDTPPKSLQIPSTKSPNLKDQFFRDFTTPPTDFEIPKFSDKVFRMTSKPVKTFATLRTFKTMKFVQKTQQPVISLQEFLKRRDEFRQEKHKDIFTRPSNEEDKKLPKTRNLSDLSEEEFSFEAKLSAEVNPSVFTFSPAHITSKTSHVVEKPPFENMIASTEPLITKSQKVTRKKAQRRRKALLSNRTQSMTPTQAYSAAEGATNLTEDGLVNNSVSTGTSRRKRDLSFLHPVTNSMKREDFNELTIPPLVISNEKFRASTKNISRNSLEDRINLHNWSYGVRQPKETRKFSENKTDSFETYQKEHRKWFGIKKKGVPVNNFDIDWEQMRRRMELHQLAASKLQKPNVKPTVIGKQLRKNERIATPLTQATTPLFLDSSEKPSNILDSMYRSALKKGGVKNYAKQLISDENTDEKVNVVYPPYGKMERDGHNAFGRLYHGKKHYQLEDSREKSFDERDLVRLVNKTYDPNFRISTHRKSNWDNRTFDPNYVFTQFVPMPGKSRTQSRSNLQEAINLIENHSTQDSINWQNVNPEIERFDVLEDQTTNRIYENKTENINETYVLARSKRVPWDNLTDIESYKVYIRSRKRFYNKTIDIAFSYFIFHKFRCGNKTRDLGYGRMSNVVNRWYNKTFIPKFRPDMFYVRNRYKRGKEFNYFKDEMNEVHANISTGEFDLVKWMQVATEINLGESNRTRSPGEKEFKEKKQKRIIQVFASGFPFKSTPVPETRIFEPDRRKQLFSTVATKVPSTKASFFQAVKEKGFGFFRSLFGKQELEEKD